MKSLFTIILLTLFTLSFGQTGKMFKGTINNTLKITLYLQGLDEGTNADPIIGSYKYDNKDEYILLKGYRNNDGNISLVEFSTVNFSGIFMGTLAQNTIIGQWISSDQKKNYPFELTEIEVNDGILNDFEKAIENKSTEFRSI